MPSVNGVSASVSEEQVRHLAQTAQIALTEEETETFAVELTSILEGVAPLKELANHEIKPMSRPLTQTNVLREDKIGDLLTQEEALQNAPEAESGMFRVSSILGGEQ